MFKIVFATDGSESARHAQQFLEMQPLAGRAEVRLVTVVSPPSTTFQQGWRAYELADSAERAWSDSVLAETSAALEARGIQVTTSARAGDIAHEIIEAARQFEADVVVVGAHGLSGLKAFFLGSVARNVAHHAPCSVLVAREPRNNLRDVVLGTDGSDHAERAAEILGRLPLPEQTRITAVSVVRPYQPVPTLMPMDAYAVEQAYQEIRDAQNLQCQHVAEDAASRLRRAGCNAAACARSGDPAAELLAQVELHHADLVVVGARGVSRIEELFVGSVAERVLKTATCSVLIAR